MRSPIPAVAKTTFVQIGLFLLVSTGSIVAGTYQNGIYEEAFFGGKVTLRLEFQPEEAVANSIREVLEIDHGYQYPYTYFQIPDFYRSSIVRYSISGPGETLVTSSSDPFDWSSRQLVSANPFRMQTTRYYRFQMSTAGSPDRYLHFALEKVESPVADVEMQVAATPWLEASRPDRPLIPADERFPAVFKISLWKADTLPKEPFTEPQVLILTIGDGEKGRLDSSAGSGRQVILSTDDRGEATFHYVYLGPAPNRQPFYETVTIGCPALELIERPRIAVGLKPRILSVVNRWESGTDLPRTMGIRIQVADEFWPDLDYLEYVQTLRLYDPEGKTLGLYVSTEWLNPPRPGNFASLLNDYLPSVSYMLREDEDSFFQGRGYVEKFDEQKFLVKAIDNPAIDLEVRFPAHVFVREGPRWLSSRVELIVAPEQVSDPLERIVGTRSEPLIYAVDVLAGGESVLQSIACSFQPTSTLQYWVKYTVNHDYFKQALVAGGGAPVILTLGAVKLFDTACDLLKGNVLGVMQGLVADYLGNVESLRQAGKIDLTVRETELLVYGIVANTAKVGNDHLTNTLPAILSNQRVLPSQGSPDPLEIPDDLDLTELRHIFTESTAGLLAGLQKSDLEMITVSGGEVELLRPDLTPYPTESIAYAIEEDEGSKVYILPENSALLRVDHVGSLEINRFLTTPSGIDVSLFQLGNMGVSATTELDCSQGPEAQALVDFGSDGSIDLTTPPEVSSFTSTEDDLDGVPAAIEDLGPHGGDSNRDGVLDSLQSNVASVPNAVDARYLTLISPAGTRLTGVQALSGLESDPAPESVSFPFGLLQFHVTNLAAEETTVEVLLPEPALVNSYYRFGMTSQESIPHWYPFLNDQQTGAQIETDRILLHYRDAHRGDDYPYIDGAIVDPGGAAFVEREHSLNFAQFASGGGLFSQILLLNLSLQDEADVAIGFRDDAGNTMPVPGISPTGSGQMQLSIPASGLRILESDSQGPVTGGSASVRSSDALAGVLIFGGDFGLAGVGHSKELTRFVAPMTRVVSQEIDTGIALMNLEEISVDLELQLYDQSGELLSTAQDNVAGLGHRAVFVDQFDWIPARAPGDFRGVLEVTASGRMAATVLQTRPGQFATLPVVDNPITPVGDGSTRLHFAQFATGGGLFSDLDLFSLDAQSGTLIRLLFRGDSGEPLSVRLGGALVHGEAEVSIPARGLLHLTTPASGDPVGGSVQVTAPGSVSGVVIFGGDFGLAGVGDSPELESFLAPMERDVPRGINTGIAVMNLESSVATLDLRLLDSNGEELARATQDLPANGHRALFVDQYDWIPVPDLSQFRGVLEVTCQTGIGVTVLQTRPGQFATLPVARR